MVGHEAVLQGRTVVAAVADPALVGALADCATKTGLLLAVVCPDPQAMLAINEQGLPGLVAFATRPEDAAGWERLIAHVEQRLGPVDGLVMAPGPDADLPGWWSAADAVLADLAARSAILVWAGPGAPYTGRAGVRRAVVSALPDPAAMAAAVLAAVAGH